MRYDPAKSGVIGFFGSLEGEVMEILWREGPLSGKDVQFLLRIRRKLSLTTVLTALARLEKKGLLSSTRPRRSKLYNPTVSRSAFLTQEIANLLAKLSEQFPDEFRTATSTGIGKAPNRAKTPKTKQKGVAKKRD